MTAQTMMITVVSRSVAQEKRWAAELGQALQGLWEVEIRGASKGGEPGSVVFVDDPSLLERVERKGRAVFLIVEESTPLPDALAESRVDGVLVHPFRPLEALGLVRQCQQLLMWEEVGRLNASFSELLAGLKDDLQLASRLQKLKLPSRFPEVKGFKVASRYLAGMRSGGDHFDLADARDSAQTSIVLTDSSSYGLSSAVLGALVRVAVKLSSDETRDCAETVRRIHEDLAATLTDKDRLSMFYGVVSRKDYRLRYLNLGSSCAFVAPKGQGFRPLSSQGQAMTLTHGVNGVTEGSVGLQPEDRLVLLSDGFIDATGGPERVRELLDRFRGAEAADCLNELVFEVKKRFAEPDDMPEQDCTAVVFDVDSKVIRLAR